MKRITQHGLPVPLRTIPVRPGWATGTAIISAIIFLALWGKVLLGHRYMLGASNLFGELPWAGTPGAHPISNVLMSDPVNQFLPWTELVSRAFRQGRLPLWDSLALSGKPLLANDQSAPFSPFTLIAVAFPSIAYGMSLAMLAKLWVAGIGMAVLVRRLGAGSTAAAFAGVAYAGSAFLIVWLAWPQSSVAALMPWVLAALEWLLASGSLVAIAGLAFALALQFLAGHAEASLHLGAALAVYAVVRLVALKHRALKPLARLLIASAIGLLLAGIQLLPFVVQLRSASLIGDRATAGTGFGHLPLSAFIAWVIPNAYGNPGIDGQGGLPPNYLETAAFVGIGALLLAGLGARWGWRHARPQAIGIIGIAAYGLGSAYGPLSPLLGRLPLFAVSNNARALMVACLALSALAGLGFQAILEGRGSFGRAWLGQAALALGGAGLLAGVALGLLFLRRGQRVDQLPTAGGMLGFWVAVGLACTVAALGFLLASRLGSRPGHAAAGFFFLALLEGAMFAGPFNPGDTPRNARPPSQAMNWLASHAGDGSIAALGPVLAPEGASLYGLRDVRGYDTVIDPRLRLFWRNADPGYHDDSLHTTLERPGIAWLAAAGVRYLMVAGDTAPSGTQVAFQAEGVTIAAIPGSRSFAFLAGSEIGASNPGEAVARLSENPLGPVVLEGRCCTGSPDATGQVAVSRREPGLVDLQVATAREGTVVILQSYSAGWEALIDDRPAAIAPADVLFQSVRVPAGRHLIRLRYRPASVLLGEIATVSGLVLTALLLLIPRLMRARAPSDRARSAPLPPGPRPAGPQGRGTASS